MQDIGAGDVPKGYDVDNMDLMELTAIQKSFIKRGAKFTGSMFSECTSGNVLQNEANTQKESCTTVCTNRLLCAKTFHPYKTSVRNV